MLLKTFFLLYFYFFLQSCNEPAQNRTAISVQDRDSAFVLQADRIADSLVQEKVLDTLSGLPEIKILQKRIDSMSNHKYRISFIIDTLIEDQYMIRAGYNGDLRFENYFNFSVNSETLEIRIEDYQTDGLIKLSDYRRIKK